MNCKELEVGDVVVVGDDIGIVSNVQIEPVVTVAGMDGEARTLAGDESDIRMACDLDDVQRNNLIRKLAAALMQERDAKKRLEDAIEQRDRTILAFRAELAELKVGLLARQVQAGG